MAGDFTCQSLLLPVQVEAGVSLFKHEKNKRQLSLTVTA